MLRFMLRSHKAILVLSTILITGCAQVTPPVPPSTTSDSPASSSSFATASLETAFAGSRKKIYIADRLNDRIVRIDNVDGSGWMTFGRTGSGVGQFLEPFWVSVDNNGRIYVADVGNHRIVRFDDMTGSNWVSLNLNGIVGREYPWTYGVFVDGSGNVYIADRLNQRIVQIEDPFEENGPRQVTFFGTHGSGIGQFRWPNAIGVDDIGRIYVADTRNHRLVRMDDITGAGWVTCGTQGRKDYQFNLPSALFVSEAGQVYVADTGNHRIVQLNWQDDECTDWVSLGRRGWGFGQFNEPTSVFVDESGRIYVADSRNHRIVRMDDMTGIGWATFGALGPRRRDLRWPWWVSYGTSRLVLTFTTCDDFQNGKQEGFRPELDERLECKDGHLQLKIPNRIFFPFVWVALTGRGTIVKIDARDGTVLGEYWSAPDGQFRQPSRTTVDLNGNVWAGHRLEPNGGSVIHIGLKENGQCVDRNGNGVIDTSSGLGDVLPWPNPGGVDSNGGVSSAEDECILHYVRTGARDVRAVAVDSHNNIWICGYDNGGPMRQCESIDGNTGIIRPDTTFPTDCGGYGALIDGNDVLWSASGNKTLLLRYDTRAVNPVPQCLDVRYTSYGLGLDSEGNIWLSHWDQDKISKINPDGHILGTFPTGGASDDRGVAVTPSDNNVWVANSGGNNISRLDNNGNLLEVITVGKTPTGVAVDANGKVWVTNRGSDNAMRIDPATNKVDLTVNLKKEGLNPPKPYNYSDMTGAVSRFIASQGTWTVIVDGEEPGTEWGAISWDTECEQQPQGTKLNARARSAEDKNGPWSDWVALGNGEKPNIPNGRYIQIELRLVSSTPGPNKPGESPLLCDVTITTGP